MKVKILKNTKALDKNIVFHVDNEATSQCGNKYKYFTLLVNSKGVWDDKHVLILEAIEYESNEGHRYYIGLKMQSSLYMDDSYSDYENKIFNAVKKDFLRYVEKTPSMAYVKCCLDRFKIFVEDYYNGRQVFDRQRIFDIKRSE